MHLGINCIQYYRYDSVYECENIIRQFSFIRQIISFQIVYMLLSCTGDSGYPLEPYLLTPFGNPSTEAEASYNRSHKRTRVLIEQTFGLLKSRFRCLHKSGGSLQYIPQKCAKIIVACLLLHNYCVKRRIPNPEMLDPDDDDDDDADDPPVAGHLNATGQDARLEVVENFFTRPRHR